MILSFVLWWYTFFTLSGEEGPSRLHNLFVQNQELMQSFQQTENHIAQVKAQLKDREVWG